jgi:hypothetical protein
MSNRYTRKDLQQYLDQCNEQLQMLHNTRHAPTFGVGPSPTPSQPFKLVFRPRYGYCAVDREAGAGYSFIGSGSPSECANKVTDFMLGQYQTAYRNVLDQRDNACEALHIATYEG